ncbi:MAG: outer membrane beta-barrel protein [Saprospiraceae bacterium]
MKNIGIRIAVVLQILFCTNYLESQNLTVGAHAGVNFQNITGKDSDGDALENELVARYALGLNLEIALASEYCLQTGLSYSIKGAQKKDDNANLNLAYIELPVNFIFKPALGQHHMLLGFGPYLAYGLSGNYKSEFNGIKLNRKVVYQSNIDYSDLFSTTEVFFAPWDAGLNLLAGFELSSGFSLQFNAQLGLVNINPVVTGFTTDDKSALKNTGFGVSIAYRFIPKNSKI